MAATSLDPLKITRDICSRIFPYPSAFEVLNEVPVSVIIYDFLELGKPKKLWANAFWLHYIGQALRDFQEYDFAASVAAPVKKVMHDVGQQVQVGRNVSNIAVNMYPVDKPLPVVVMHQPVLVENRDHPLLLACQFNNFSGEDTTSLAEPMDVHFKQNLCQKSYRFPDALDMLNEFPALFTLYDFRDATRPRVLWANFGWQQELKVGMEELQRDANFADVTPSIINQNVGTIMQEVQKNRQTMALELTIDCIASPVRAQAILRPLLLDGSDQPVVLCTFVSAGRKREEKKDKEGESSRNDASMFEKQVMFLLDEGAAFFDFESGTTFGEAIWLNFHNANEYGVVHDCTQPRTADGTTLTLKRVLQSFVWASNDDEERALSDLISLPFDADPLVMTCMKRRKNQSGGQVWHKLTFSQCKNPYTGKNCLLLLESDVSSLMLAHRDLQASNHLKDQFLQCMSHELRTPLSGIMGLSSALTAAPRCPQNIKTALQTIDQSAKHLNALVTDILETAECLSGSFRLESSRLDLAHACEQVCDVMRSRVGGAVTLRNRLLGCDEFVVEADRDRVLKVLSHLIGNAVKFTSRGSIDISATVNDEMVCVSVADTGCGIAPAMLDKVWTHFQQGDMSSTRVHGGTGLGLALVKLIVTAHGGRVNCASKQNEGSTFSFSLPVEQTPPMASFASLERNASFRLGRSSDAAKAAEQKEKEERASIKEEEEEEVVVVEEEEEDGGRVRCVDLAVQLRAAQEKVEELTMKLERREKCYGTQPTEETTRQGRACAVCRARGHGLGSELGECEQKEVRQARVEAAGGFGGNAQGERRGANRDCDALHTNAGRGGLVQREPDSGAVTEGGGRVGFEPSAGEEQGREKRIRGEFARQVQSLEQQRRRLLQRLEAEQRTAQELRDVVDTLQEQLQHMNNGCSPSLHIERSPGHCAALADTSGSGLEARQHGGDDTAIAGNAATLAQEGRPPLDRRMEGAEPCVWCRQGEAQLERAMRVLQRVRREWVQRGQGYRQGIVCKV